MSRPTPQGLVVRVVNDTWEELQLDVAAIDREAWSLPVVIRARSAAVFRAKQVSYSEHEWGVTYHIDGDRDRPVYFYFYSDHDDAADGVEVWTPPTCCARVVAVAATIEVEVVPAERHAAQHAA